MKTFTVTVSYQDWRQGPETWKHRIECGHIRVAINRALANFYAERPFRGRLPLKLIAVSAVRVA